MGVAALVVGVASLVAALSFVLFPLGFIGGIVAVIFGIIARTGGRAAGATNSGQAVAGIVCGVLALVIAVTFGVRVRTLVADNTSVFTRFDNLHRQGQRSHRGLNCIARLSTDIRP
jgi:hypothetical protein